MSEVAPAGDIDGKPEVAPKPGGPFRSPFDPAQGLEDGRKPWDWKPKYGDGEARRHINEEAWMAGVYLAFFLLSSGICAGFSGNIVSFNIGSATFVISPALLLTYFVGGLGSTTFSIKWLIHSVATGKWHRDRIYWRIFVPLVGGVYALVVINLMSGGLMSRPGEPGAIESGKAWALAFLVGYFSDGVSGLLSNVANAVFGTVERK
jgi:hypothetical protein